MTPIMDDIQHGLAALLQLVVGALLLGLGIVGLWWEKTHVPAHDAHLAGALVVALVGASIMPSIGPVLLKSLKGIVEVLLSVFPTRPPQGGGQ